MGLVKYVRLDETKIFTIFSVVFLRANWLGRGKIGLRTSMWETVFIFYSKALYACAFWGCRKGRQRSCLYSAYLEENNALLYWVKGRLLLDICG